MELVEALSLGGKQQLLLVVCDGQRYLVGTGGDSVQSIVPMGQQLVQSAGANAETGKSVGGTRAHGIRMVVRPGAEDVGCGW